MKRLVSLLLSIGMCLCLIPAKTMAAGGFQEGDFTYTMITGDTLRIDSYQGQNADVVIPDKVVHSGDTYTVTTIGSEAFANEAFLISVDMPDTITSIYTGAFSACTNLESVRLSLNLSESLTSVFEDCTSLKTIDIPGGVKELGWHAFENCTSLTNVKMHDGTQEISMFAFRYCTSLTSINIPETVTRVDWYSFNGCSSLKTIILPSSLTDIGGQVFTGCTSLDSIICKALTTPSSFAEDIYGLTKNTIDVYVDSSSVEAYEANSQWNYQNIRSTSDVRGAIGFVYRLYQKVLGRTPDSEGVQNWYNALMSGTSGADCARGFFYSPEFLSKNLSNEAFVELLYNVFLDRSSDPSGKAGWVASLNSGASRSSVIDGFVNSVEWANVCKNYGITSGGNAVATVSVEPSAKFVSFVTRLYNISLNRNPDSQGLTDWSSQLANQQITGTQTSYGFFMSPEFVNSNYSNEEYVTRLYNAFLGRDPDAAGFANWVDALNSGSSRESVFYGFANSNEFSGICRSYGIRR